MAINNDVHLGKIPPSDIELEQAILGAVIIESETILTVSEILTKPDVFYKQEHVIIYNCLLDMHSKDIVIDLLTVTDQLRQKGVLEQVGGAFTIAGLIKNVASAIHIEYHATVIHELYIKRKLSSLGHEISSNSFNLSIDSTSILSKINASIDEIFTTNSIGARSINDSLNEVCDDIRNQQGKDKVIYGFPSSITSVRKLVPYWENKRLIVIAARPGMGKTILGLQEAIECSKNHGPCLFFSLEMSHKQLTKRALLINDSMHKYIFESNNLKEQDYNKLDNSLSYLSNANLFIDDESVNLISITNRVKIFKKKHNLKAVVIDYLQLIEGDKSLVREQQVAQISRTLKLLAKKINIPIIILAQINRESDNRKSEGYKPKISDLRESGALEQDADIIAFPHRAGYYEKGNDKAWIIIAKNRDGETGMAEVRLNKNFSKFIDVNKDLPF